MQKSGSGNTPSPNIFNIKRQAAKTAGFAMLYGGGPDSFFHKCPHCDSYFRPGKHESSSIDECMILNVMNS